MRPGLTIDEFLKRAHKKKPVLGFSQVELEREIRLSRQAAVGFDAADYLNVTGTPGIAVVENRASSYSNRLDHPSQDFISRQNQATTRHEQIAT